MKREALIILSILLVLYIVPSNLTGSSDVAARQNEPNVTEDFIPADSFVTDPMVASGGNDSNYIRALSINSEYYESVPASSKTLDFTNTYGGRIENVIYGFYGIGGSGILKIWNGATWISVKTITSETWYNGTYPLSLYYAENVTFALTGYISCDYLEVRLNITPTSWHVIEAPALLWFDTPGWNIIITAILNFATPLDERLVNWLLVFLGLCMIPASTLYLVKGGKEDMSANKFFYFCIAFMLGWGLLLGGIMP